MENAFESPSLENSDLSEGEVNDLLIRYETSAHGQQILSEFISEYMLILCKEAINELTIDYLQAR